MKTLIVSFCVLLGGAALARPRVSVSSLPSGGWADTEASTNLAFVVGPDYSRHFDLTLELAATPSNNVVVALGRDADEDGVLSLDEEGLEIGWDCGNWFLRPGLASSSCPRAAWSVASETELSVKRLALSAEATPNGLAQLTLVENEAPLAAPEPAALGGLWSRDWNRLRVTVRGLDHADESVSAKITVEGTLIHIN